MNRGVRFSLVAVAVGALAMPGLGCGADAEVVAQQVRDYVSNVSSGTGGAEGALVEGAPPAPSGGPEASVTIDSANPVPGGSVTATVSADIPFGAILVRIEEADDYFQLTLPEPVLQSQVVVELSDDLSAGELALLFAVTAGDLVGPFTRVTVEIGSEPTSPFTLACAEGNADQEVYVLDGETGAATAVGGLGEIANWSSQLVVNRDGTVVHAIGYADLAGLTVNLHTLDLDSGEARQVPVDDQYLLAGTTGEGEVVAVTRSIEAVTEATVFLLDPDTGVATRAGTLGPASWIGDGNGGLVARYHPASDRVYALSQSEAGDTERLWWLALADGSATSVAVVGSSGAFIVGGVRSNGHLVGLVRGVEQDRTWRVATLDPATGRLSELLEIPELQPLGGRLTVDPVADVAYAVEEPFGQPQTQLYRVELAGPSATTLTTRACTLALY